MPLFDRYAIVDWSAANTPTTGKDSIWIALAEREGGEAGGRAAGPQALQRRPDAVRDDVGQRIAQEVRVPRPASR